MLRVRDRSAPAMGVGACRLQKWLSHVGVASRRESEAWIRAGRVEVNGQAATIGQVVVPGQDRVSIDGKAVEWQAPPRIYLLLHKPDRTLCSRKQDGDKPRIFDLPQLKKHPLYLYPVGRLDYRSEGLLLLTNDGEFCNEMTHPRHKVERYYQVLIKGKLSPEQLAALRRGVPLEDGRAACEITPAYGVNLGKSSGTWYFVTVREGRNRLVRRLFAHFKADVVRLVRYGLGPLRLSTQLKPGQYRQLTKHELQLLRRAAQKDRRPESKQA